MERVGLTNRRWALLAGALLAGCATAPERKCTPDPYGRCQDEVRAAQLAEQTDKGRREVWELVTSLPLDDLALEGLSRQRGEVPMPADKAARLEGLLAECAFLEFTGDEEPYARLRQAYALACGVLEDGYRQGYLETPDPKLPAQMHGWVCGKVAAAHPEDPVYRRCDPARPQARHFNAAWGAPLTQEDRAQAKARAVAERRAELDRAHGFDLLQLLSRADSPGTQADLDRLLAELRALPPTPAVDNRLAAELRYVRGRSGGFAALESAVTARTRAALAAAEGRPLLHLLLGLRAQGLGLLTETEWAAEKKRAFEASRWVVMLSQVPRGCEPLRPSGPGGGPHLLVQVRLEGGCFSAPVREFDTQDPEYQPLAGPTGPSSPAGIQTVTRTRTVQVCHPVTSQLCSGNSFVSCSTVTRQECSDEMQTYTEIVPADRSSPGPAAPGPPPTYRTTHHKEVRVGLAGRLVVGVGATFPVPVKLSGGAADTAFETEHEHQAFRPGFGPELAWQDLKAQLERTLGEVASSRQFREALVQQDLAAAAAAEQAGQLAEAAEHSLRALAEGAMPGQVDAAIYARTGYHADTVRDMLGFKPWE